MVTIRIGIEIAEADGGQILPFRELSPELFE
jgi:hypothetical protein